MLFDALARVSATPEEVSHLVECQHLARHRPPVVERDPHPPVDLRINNQLGFYALRETRRFDSR